MPIFDHQRRRYLNGFIDIYFAVILMIFSGNSQSVLIPRGGVNVLDDTMISRTKWSNIFILKLKKWSKLTDFDDLEALQKNIDI